MRALVLCRQATDYARRLFDAMLAAHDVAAENMKVGAVAEDVDKRPGSNPQSRFEKFLRHRPGTASGCNHMKPPWISRVIRRSSRGNDVQCEPEFTIPSGAAFDTPTLSWWER